MKLQGDRSRAPDNAIYRIASSSLAASIEELLRVLMHTHLSNAAGSERLTLGDRLSLIRKRVELNAQGDFDHEFFRKFNDFMLYLRNSTTHKGKPLTDLERFKADLSVKMSFPFLAFYTDIVLPLLGGGAAARPLTIVRHAASAVVPTEKFVVGLDGDNTGAILEDLFCSASDEKTFKYLSQGVVQAIAKSPNVLRGPNKIGVGITAEDK